MSGDLERLARAAAKALTGGHPSKPKSIDYAAVRAVLLQLREPSNKAVLRVATAICEERTWPGAWARASEVEHAAWYRDAWAAIHALVDAILEETRHD